MKQRPLTDLPDEIIEAVEKGRAIDEELQRIIEEREKLNEKETNLLAEKFDLMGKAGRGNARPETPGKAGTDTGGSPMSKKENKSSGVRKQIQPTQVQLSLFYYEVTESYSNVVHLYNELPKFVCDAPRDQKHLDSIERGFKVDGSRYRITLHPARLKDSDGQMVEQFVGIREELVEDAITKIAIEKKRLFVLQDTTRIRISIREIDIELGRIGKRYSYPEIKEAILVLAGARMVIEDEKGEALWTTSTYPEVMLSTNADDGEGFVQLHPLVCEGIKHGLYSQYDYTLAMGLPGRYSRRLYKLLAHKFTWASVGRDPYTVHLHSFVEKHGFRLYDRITDNAKMFRESLTALKKANVIESWTETPQREGRKTVDVWFEVKPTHQFATAMKRSQGIKSQVKERLE